jgi:hypothetical protein
MVIEHPAEAAALASLVLSENPAPSARLAAWMVRVEEFVAAVNIMVNEILNAARHDVAARASRAVRASTDGQLARLFGS